MACRDVLYMGCRDALAGPLRASLAALPASYDAGRREDVQSPLTNNKKPNILNALDCEPVFI